MKKNPTVSPPLATNVCQACRLNLPSLAEPASSHRSHNAGQVEDNLKVTITFGQLSQTGLTSQQIHSFLSQLESPNSSINYKETGIAILVQTGISGRQTNLILQEGYNRLGKVGWGFFLPQKKKPTWLRTDGCALHAGDDDRGARPH